jgi:hypothetical protein
MARLTKNGMSKAQNCPFKTASVTSFNVESAVAQRASVSCAEAVSHIPSKLDIGTSRG